MILKGYAHWGTDVVSHLHGMFAFVISDPWNGPYKGPSVKPADNTTLKGKVMAGYQGWFRTPNDPEGRGWVHWGKIQQGTFSTDMWPDVSQYPPSILEKAAAVKACNEWHSVQGKDASLHGEPLGPVQWLAMGCSGAALWLAIGRR